MVIVSIKDNLFKNLSEIAKKENTTEDKLISDVIETFLKKENEEILSFEDLMGIATVDEHFSAVEDVRKLRNGEL
ncbi:MAG: hypothetical protein FWH29_08910 [Methanobrevibacter sp.]|nr:hypothetical protein [Methanobrevibacter sp.]